MIKLNGYLIAISVLVVLVSSETVDNRTTPHNDRLPTQPPNPLPQEGTTTTVRFLNQGTPGAPTTQPPPATTTQPVGRGPTPVRSTQVSPARQNQTPARATSSSSRPPTPTARSPSPARQGQTPAGPSTSRPPTPTRSSSMRPTPTRPASSGTSGSSTSRRTTPQNQEVSSGSMRTTPRSTPTQGSPTSSGSRRTTPASTTGGSTSMSSPTLSPTTILTPEFTTPTPSQGISSGVSAELSTAGVTTLGVTSAGVSTAGVSTETVGVSTTTSGSSSMSSSPSTSPVVSTSLSTESSSGSPSTTTPISSSTSSGSTTTASTSSSSVSTSMSTASSSSASSSGSSSSSSESTSTSASTTPTSTASSTSTSISSPTTPTSTASSTSTTLPDTPSTPTTPTSTPSSTTPSTTPTSMSSTLSTTPGNGGGQLIHTQIMFCNKYGSYFLPQDPISYQEYIKHLMMAIASTCGVGPDRIQRLEMVEDPPSANTLIQFDVLPGPGLSTEDLVMKIQEQVSTGQFKVTDKYGNVFSVQCSLPIYPMCPWTDYGPCPREQCQHGGICRVAVSCQYFCECRSGWFGQFCEKGAETTKPPEPVKKKDNLWLLWLLIVPLVLLGLLALLLLCCCCHRCCCWGASAGPRKVQIIEEDIYQDVPACSQHGSIRSCRSMHSARPSSIYAVNPPQMASDAGSTYYHALGRPFAVAFSDNTFSAIGYATNDMGIYNSSGRKMLPAASCCGDDEIEVIMNNPGRRGSCCGSMISETGSGYHSALGNRYAVAYNDRAFNAYSSMPRMGSIRHYN